MTLTYFVIAYCSGCLLCIGIVASLLAWSKRRGIMPPNITPLVGSLLIIGWPLFFAQLTFIAASEELAFRRERRRKK